MTDGYAASKRAFMGPDVHANRPPASLMGIGTLYACTTHNTLECLRADGSWYDWFVPPAAGQAPDLSGYQLRSEEGQPNGYASLDVSGLVPDAQIPAGITRDSEMTTALGSYQATSQKGAVGGYASLDQGGKVPLAQLPSLSSPPSYGTTLPASPVDGQEAILVDSLNNPSYQWRFRYSTQSGSTYKWEFIGGSMKTLSGDLGGARLDALNNAGGWWYWSSLLFTLPRAGDYIVGANVTGDGGISGGDVLQMALLRTSPVVAAPLGNSLVSYKVFLGAKWALAIQNVRVLAASASDVLTAAFTGNGGCTFNNIVFYVQPIRVS